MTAPNPVRKWLLWVIALIVYSGGTTAGVIGLAEGLHVANCLNGSLADRNGLQATDAKAHVDFARGLEAFTNTLAHHRPTSADIAHLAAVSATYERVLSADAAFRSAHPLGRC